MNSGSPPPVENRALVSSPGGMEMHPYCEIFPRMSDEELDGLVDSIKKSGLLEAIITFEGKILDGRNRFAACEKAGVRPHFIACPEADPLDYVEAKNLARRNLSPSQRAFAFQKLTGMRRGSQESSNDGQPSFISSSEAARRGNVDRTSINLARAAAKGGVPELHREIEQGNVTVKAAARFATLPPEEQKAIAAQGPEAIIAKAKKIKKSTRPEPEAEYSPSEQAEQSIITTQDGGPSAPGRISYRPDKGLVILQQTMATIERVTKDDIYYEEAHVKMVHHCADKLSRFRARRRKHSYRADADTAGTGLALQVTGILDALSVEDAHYDTAMNLVIRHCQILLENRGGK